MLFKNLSVIVLWTNVASALEWIILNSTFYYPAAKWVPSINKAVLKSVCAICCQLLWNIPQGIEMVSVRTGLLGKELQEGHVSTSGDTRL